VSEADLVARFRALAEERLRRLNQGLLDLEQGTGTTATVDDVLREIHTIKGESRMLGLLAIHRVAHRTEDVLQHARKTKSFRDASLLEAAYAGLDLLSAYVDEGDAASESADEPRAAAFDAHAAEALAQGGGAPREVPAAAKTTEEAPEPVAAEAVPEGAPKESGAPRAGVVRVAGDLVDDLTRTAGVLGLLQVRIDHAARAAVRAQQQAAVATRDLAEATSTEERRAAAEREAARSKDLVAELRALREACFAASLRHQRLREGVSSLRLAPVSGLLGRYPRTVRDLAKELGKEARAEVHGGDVGVDQAVLDALADPLLHLVRNAIDHGLEAPSVRASVGKPAHGTIVLSAEHAGRFVEIRVRDDGRGIDREVVGAAAVRQGLLSESDVARMSTEELYEQLFRPSFSTRGTVTEVSGRGIGLDVVRRAVEGLGGSVRIRSEVGTGTEFTLRVPVSSALVDALVVEAGAAVAAVPAAYVEGALEAAADRVEAVGGSPTLRLEGGARAVIVEVAALFAVEPPPREGDGGRFVVLMEGGRRLALRVQRFLGERTLVQETLDPFLRGLEGVTGTALLDDGRLVPIVNVVQLFAWAREDRARAVARRAEPSAPPKSTAIVAEDSELTRRLVADALRRGGLDVVEAVDGQDALDRAMASPPSIVVTDLEMPRMDGIALIRALRAAPALAGVPIIVFSTRDRPESKREAAEAGADAYLVKREFEETALLHAVTTLLARASETRT